METVENVRQQESSGFRMDTNILRTEHKAIARRSQLEIKMDMLKAVKEGAEKPTQIMYRANLSWVALQTNLKLLIEKGMLKWASDGTRKHYELTLKGSSLMYSYWKITEEVGEEPEVSFAFG